MRLLEKCNTLLFTGRNEMCTAHNGRHASALLGVSVMTEVLANTQLC